MEQLSFIKILAILVLRYLVFAGGAYLFVWVLGRKALSGKKLAHQRPPRGQISREVGWSLLTSAIFAVAGKLIFVVWGKGLTLIYMDIGRYGVAYFFSSVLLLMCLHDTYFYWTHRWMHTRLLFRWFHRVHHESESPTPFAAFSFHPLEAVVEAAILPILVFVVPTHPMALLLFLFLMTALSVINHLGYELYPGIVFSGWPGKAWLSTSHHNMHHRRFGYNFGLYFTTWDKWMGTEDPTYAEHERCLRKPRRRRLFSTPKLDPINFFRNPLQS